MEHNINLKIENLNISCCRSRSPDSAKFSHFALLFCREHTKLSKIYDARAQLAVVTVVVS